MYERLPLDFIGITEYFGNRIDPITNVSSYHYAVDFGWNKYQGEPVYASYDATVVLEAFDNNLGNYIVLMHDKESKRIITRYLHLKNRSTLKKGTKVKRGQIIGYMGSTGYSTGTHLHFEYWICPKNYTYNYADRSKYAKDPLQYCYLFEDQKASAKSLPKLKKVVGKPVTKNTEKNQIKVVGEYLNCRTEPSLQSTILGYIDFGYYNIINKKENDDYTWYQIDTNKWVADVDDDIEIYELKEESCEKLRKENEELKKELESKNKIIENLTNNINKNYNLFKAPSSDYYYIYLNKDEIIYYPK